MKPLRKILAVLDFKATDESVVKNALWFVRQEQHAKLFIAHVIPDALITFGAEDLIHSLFSPGFHLDENIADALVSRVINHAGEGKEIDCEVFVREGHPLRELVQLCRETQPDLLIIGKKKNETTGGTLPGRVARLTDCNVLFAVENSVLNFHNNKILVPIDFSDLSLKALNNARSLFAGQYVSPITALYILDYPPSTEYLARRYGLLSPDWESRLNALFDKSLAKHRIERGQIIFKAVKDEKFSIPIQILNVAQDISADLIVMGARGHRSFDDFFLGSVTEKVVSLTEKFPVLIIR